MTVTKIWICCFLLFACVLQANAQTIKLGTLAPEGSPWYESLTDMGQTWSKETSGKIDVKIYPGGVIGDESDMVRKMRIGQLHAAALTVVGLSQIIPEINVFQLPLLFDSYEELDYVRDRVAPKLEKLLEEKGFIVLNWADAGWVHVFSQRPVIYPKDLQKEKIFVWAGQTQAFNAWKVAGFHPVEVSATDIITSLQTGLITSFLTTPLAALSFQWFALAQNMSDFRYAPLIGATVITKKKWDSLPAKTRDLLKPAAASSGQKLKDEIRALDKKAIDIMKKNGLKVHTVTEDAVVEWRKVADQHVYGEYLEQTVPKYMFDEVQKLLKEFRAAKANTGKK